MDGSTNKKPAPPSPPAAGGPAGGKVVPTRMDVEFARQALGERVMTQAQLDQSLGAQQAYADRGIQRALAVVVCGLQFLPARHIEQLLRHVIRRLNGMPIGHYLCLDQIGHGGMGMVYLAQDTRTGANVALKTLMREDLNERAISRFRHEAQVAKRVRHPNVVAALELGEADGWHYFAMEYVPGRTLSRVVAESGALPDVAAIRITAQIADALAHMHEQGIIHRDVKPANILVMPDGTAKLCDLGLSAIRNLDETHLREAGKTVGSRRFISPEQSRGLHNVDERTDIYSLGLCLYYMVAGKLPFADVPIAELVGEHQKGRLPWPAEVNPAASHEVSWMVTRMASTDPAQRYATMRENHHDLLALARQLGEEGRG